MARLARVLPIFVALLAPPSSAYARRGLVIVGAGDTIGHLVDADLSGDPELAASLDFDEPAIGYRYEYVSFFFLDVWTGSGQIVLFDQASDRYVPLNDAQVEDLTGRTADSFGKPFLYRVPLGLVVIAAIVGFGAFVMWRQWRALP